MQKQSEQSLPPQEALRQSERRLRAIFNNAAVMVAIADASGRLVQVNQKAADVLGYTVDELQQLRYSDITHPDDLAESRRISGQVLQGEIEQCHYEKRYLRKDRAVVWGFVSLSAIRDERGAVEAVIAVVTDITARKQAEEEAHAAQARVLELQREEQQQVEAELQKLSERLIRQTQLATIGQLSASIAHELRNPLGVIRNAAYFLKRQVPPEYPKWAQYLDTVEQQTIIASRIINDMLAMTRGEPPAKKPVALGAILEAARAGLDAPAEVQWRFVYPEDPLMIDADAIQFEQVFRNLFANSLRAMGGAGQIAVEAVRGDTSDDILVMDTGPGIPAELRGRIFEPLVSGRSRGSGLGLTICRQIIERHGGTIDVCDVPQGAQFRIRLPRA